MMGYNNEDFNKYGLTVEQKNYVRQSLSTYDFPFNQNKPYIVFPSADRIIVCLCGSTKFVEQYMIAYKEETLKGKIAIGTMFFHHKDDFPIMTPSIENSLAELHCAKILIAHELLVIDVGGYIGESTQREINFGAFLEKRIRYWSDEVREYTKEDKYKTEKLE